MVQSLKMGTREILESKCEQARDTDHTTLLCAEGLRNMGRPNTMFLVCLKDMYTKILALPTY